MEGPAVRMKELRTVGGKKTLYSTEGEKCEMTAGICRPLGSILCPCDDELC